MKMIAGDFFERITQDNVRFIDIAEKYKTTTVRP
jgi:hypothetical protein